MGLWGFIHSQIQSWCFSLSIVALWRCTDLLHTFWWWKAQSKFLWPERAQEQACKCIWWCIWVLCLCVCEKYVVVFIFIRSLSQLSLTPSTCRGNAKLGWCWIAYQWLFGVYYYFYSLTVDNVTTDSGLTVKQKNRNSVSAFQEQL